MEGHCAVVCRRQAPPKAVCRGCRALASDLDPARGINPFGLSGGPSRRETRVCGRVKTRLWGCLYHHASADENWARRNLCGASGNNLSHCIVEKLFSRIRLEMRRSLWSVLTRKVDSVPFVRHLCYTGHSLDAERTHTGAALVSRTQIPRVPVAPLQLCHRRQDRKPCLPDAGCRAVKRSNRRAPQVSFSTIRRRGRDIFWQMIYIVAIDRWTVVSLAKGATLGEPVSPTISHTVQHTSRSTRPFFSPTSAFHSDKNQTTEDVCRPPLRSISCDAITEPKGTNASPKTQATCRRVTHSASGA